jgi:Tol biopolymer transport system component
MSRMRCAWFLLLLPALTITLWAGVLAQPQKAPQQAEVLFESAKQKEVVEGKLQEAIQLYQRIVQEFAANRPVAAKALLRMGQCYERLGQADARKAYERLVREFSDQAESVAEARSRLAALAVPTATKKPELAARQVWANADDLTGSPSSDGRFMATTDWTTGDIAIRDLATGDMRKVTKTGDIMNIMKTTAFGYYAKFSPDDKQIAYAWNVETVRGHFELWAVGADGTGARRRYRDEKAGVILPYCWTPDGKSIVAMAYMTRADNSRQIVLVSAESGAVRVLKSASQSEPQPSTLDVSPDGRFLVYDAAPKDGNGDISVMSLQDGREAKLVEHPAEDSRPIWTPDGRRVLFVSDRTGSAGLWAQEVVDGRAVGQPELVRPDTGRVSPMRFTKSGAMY